MSKTDVKLHEQPRHHLGGPPPPSGVRTLALITEVRANTLMVSVGGATEIEAIKPTKVCPALDVAGVTGYTYDYSGDAVEQQTRTSTKDGDVETQTVVPRFLIGDIVEIGNAPAGLKTHAPALATIKKQVVNHPAFWDKVREGGV